MNRPFETLIGKTLIGVDKTDDQIIFHCDDGTTYVQGHSQDCCENVSVEDVIGDLADLIGSLIVEAEEAISDKNPDDVKKEYQDSFTWTFYKLATRKGRVTIRWYGESNGYYSESVYFEEVEQ